MKRLNLRLLDVFCAVYETGKVTEAAARLGVTQPAISKAISEIEQDLGIQLFGRHKRRLVPTSDAQLLFAESSRLFAQLASFQDKVKEIQIGQLGDLSIGSIPTLATSILSQATAKFSKSAPQIKVNIVVGSRDQVIEEVVRHKVEFGIVHAPVIHRDVQIEIIGESEIVAIVPAKNALAQNASVTPRRLANKPIIMLDAATPASHLIREAFEEAQVRLSVVLEANSSAVAFSAATAGRGIALIDPWPKLLTGHPQPPMCKFRPRIPLRIALVWSSLRPVSRPAELMKDQIRAYIREIARRSKFVRVRAANKSS
jgi:DNA-binding transcriptional LysR family regulator